MCTLVCVLTFPSGCLTDGAALDTGQPGRLLSDRGDRGLIPGDGAAGSGLLLLLFLFVNGVFVCGTKRMVVNTDLCVRQKTGAT